MESGSRRLESPSPAERSRRLRPRAGLTALLLAACALRAGLTALLLAACALRAAGGPPQAAPPEAPPLEGARVIPAAVAAGRAEDFSAPNARPLVASADDLLRALDHLLLAAYPGRTLRWELVREGPFPDRAGRRFGLVPPSALAGGRVWFELEALDPPAATYLLPVDIAWQDSAWIAARPLPAGRCLAPADAARGLCWHARAPAALAGGAVEGLRLTRSIPAGRRFWPRTWCVCPTCPAAPSCASSTRGRGWSSPRAPRHSTRAGRAARSACSRSIPGTSAPRSCAAPKSRR